MGLGQTRRETRGLVCSHALFTCGAETCAVLSPTEPLPRRVQGFHAWEVEKGKEGSRGVRVCGVVYTGAEAAV